MKGRKGKEKKRKKKCQDQTKETSKERWGKFKRIYIFSFISQVHLLRRRNDFKRYKKLNEQKGKREKKVI